MLASFLVCDEGKTPTFEYFPFSSSQYVQEDYDCFLLRFSTPPTSREQYSFCVLCFFRVLRCSFKKTNRGTLEPRIMNLGQVESKIHKLSISAKGFS